jgi:DNA helicase IV
MLWRTLAAQVNAPGNVSAPGYVSAPGNGKPADPTEGLTPEEIGRSLRHRPEVVEVLERMWPVLTPEELLRDLFGAPPLIDSAAEQVLNAEERGLLPRDRTDEGWTEADVPLLDEARALLGPRRRRSATEEEIRTYGHIVVDEAQDLTPMQLRMVARRSLSGSMTVVGDLAQATGPWVPASWSQVAELLPGRRGWRLAELSVNYRTPGEIMQFAARILEQAAPGMRSPESVRAGGTQPQILRATSQEDALPGDALSAMTAKAVLKALDDLAGQGTVAAIVPPSLFEVVAEAFSASEIEFGLVSGGTALQDQVTLLTISDAKGLEFDKVVVVEPAGIVRESAQGLRSLYVACTRATKALTIVHSELLPSSMATAAV